MKGLIVFVKTPEKGKVKTRLASSIGDEKALRVYQKLLDYTRGVALRANVDRVYLFHSGVSDKNIKWDGANILNQIQAGKDLGEKMKNAFDYVFSDGCKQVSIIGSDCIDLTGKHIEQAFLSLNYADVVVGPAFDGGYYLLAMSGFYPEVFDKVEWSTSNVLDKTLDNINKARLNHFLLETLSDIDREEDLQGKIDWEKL